MGKTVRIKLRCTSTGVSADSSYTADGKPPEKQHTASFAAVYGDSPENKEFFKYTPSASLSLGVTREQYFEAGREYFVDINVVDIKLAD